MSLAQPRSVRNFVGGAFVDPVADEWIDDLAPATGELIARIPASGAADVDAAVAAGRAALAGAWGRTSVAERADRLDAIADVLERRAEEIVAIESLDAGKPSALARRLDVPRAIANFRFFAGAVRHDETGFFGSEKALNYTLRRPLGVVAVITPWNLPLYLLSWKVAPALAMGNAVVAKPSELTPLTADLLAHVVAEVGLPAGAFNVVHGLGPAAGQALVEHPDVAAVSFTGGTATGKRVAATAAPAFKKLSLELGGKNPTIVFADADPQAAIDGACRAAFTNQGEICLCGSRIFVERSAYAEFVDGFVKRARALKIGDPAAADTEVGALISQAHRAKVEGYVALAKQEGGEVVCGGARPSLPSPLDGGAFLEPTVITGLSPTCRTATEEIFGPVVTVHPFDSEDEAVALANGVRYGLSASVWTRDLSRGHRVAAALDTGIVWVNTWLLRDLRTAFGGTKDSGVGREGGRWSLDFYSDTRNVCVAL